MTEQPHEHLPSLRPGGLPQVRLSDADREQAAQHLHRAVAEGRITMVELDERLVTIYAAMYPADLLAPLADLPTQMPNAGIAVPSAAGLVAQPAQTPGKPVRLSVTSGTIKRKGDWIVPADLEITVNSGAVVLDLTQARVPSLVRVTVKIGSGTVKVLVPDGLTADVSEVQPRSGSVRSKLAGAPGAAPHLVFVGTVASGTLVVRRPMFGS